MLSRILTLNSTIEYKETYRLVVGLSWHVNELIESGLNETITTPNENFISKYNARNN